MQEIKHPSYSMHLSKMIFNVIYNQDCYEGLTSLPDESIDLTVTSPPYFNAREYSQWSTLEDYLSDMTKIFSEVYRVTKNHHYTVVNVGDITSQTGNTVNATRRVPLGAYFITMMEQIGYIFMDDYIWDKGEPQSKRHLGNPPYPFYQLPVNCYEHILVFAKNQVDKTKIPCPDCGESLTQANGCTSIGVYSWECKNPQCPTKSEGGRGKRFSKRSVMMSNYQRDENEIPGDFVQKWRRDIVKINPVIKINCNGENIAHHTAPYPKEIPEMAIRYFSGVGDLVLDPFMGSGTTAVACTELDRKYIGYEIHTEYIDVASARIDEAKIERQSKLW